MKKNIEPIYKGRWHGYQEWYYDSGNIELRGVFKHGKAIGYKENHSWEIAIYHIR